MRLSKLARRIDGTKPDVRWLFPITMILIAALLAFSAEMWERAAARSGSASPATAVSQGH